MPDQTQVQSQNIFRTQISSPEELVDAVKLLIPYLKAETSTVKLVEHKEQDGGEHYTILASHMRQVTTNREPYQAFEIINVQINDRLIINFTLQAVES